MIAKFMSRKLLVTIGTGLLNVLVLAGVIHPVGQNLIIGAVNALSGLYVIVQGVIDAIHGQTF
jgi:hypothetical protein